MPTLSAHFVNCHTLSWLFSCDKKAGPGIFSLQFIYVSVIMCDWLIFVVWWRWRVHSRTFQTRLSRDVTSAWTPAGIPGSDWLLARVTWSDRPMGRLHPHNSETVCVYTALLSIHPTLSIGYAKCQLKFSSNNLLRLFTAFKIFLFPCQFPESIEKYSNWQQLSLESDVRMNESRVSSSSILINFSNISVFRSCKNIVDILVITGCLDQSPSQPNTAPIGSCPASISHLLSPHFPPQSDNLTQTFPPSIQPSGAWHLSTPVKLFWLENTSNRNKVLKIYIE